MEDAVRTARCARKRAAGIIDDEESTNGQPGLKSPKIEVKAVPSAEVVAEAAESRLDSKDDFQAEKKRADDLEISLAEVVAQLEEAESRVNELTLDNEALKTELAETKRAQQEKIDELTGKLEQSDAALLQLQMQAMDVHEGKATSDAPSLLNSKELQSICHPTNIFQLCSPDANQTMPLKKARKKFFDIAESARRFPLLSKRDLLRALVNRCFASSPQTLLSSLHCEACELTVDECDVIDHFVFKGHQTKASALCAAVSHAALTYWLNKLKSAAQSKQQVAAAAAAPKVGEPPNELKMEEDDG